MRRYALRDDQWDRIKDILPGREGHVGVTAKDNRLFVEAVIYRYRAGIPWRDLPERFGDPIKYIRASRAGPGVGCGRSCLRCWQAMQTMSTP
jgi:transposase